MLKVGIIGVGGIAGTHVPGWAASEHAELVAGCDNDPEALKVWGRECGVGKLYADCSNLIEDSEIDIVDVCTPNVHHAPMVMAALVAGKHVICEKPLAATPEEIEQMIAARDKAGKLLMTAQHFRYTSTAIALKREIDTGVLGEIYHARAWFLRRSLIPTREGFILKKNSGGGACLDVGVHILDLALWMMGNPTAVSVSGTVRTELAKVKGAFSTFDGSDVPKGMDVEEFAAAFVREWCEPDPGSQLVAPSRHGAGADRDVALRQEGRSPVASMSDPREQP